MPRSLLLWMTQLISHRLLLVLMLTALLSGCSGSEYVRLRETPKNPLAGTLQLLSRGGPQPTERTLQFLRRHDLEESLDEPAGTLLSGMQHAMADEPTAEAYYAMAELAYLCGKKVELLQPEEALDCYGLAVAHAYLYLFDEHFSIGRNPYDPQFRRSCDVYNAALEGALRLAQEDIELQPGQMFTIQTANQRIEVDVQYRGAWQAEEIERFEFVSDYEVQGLANLHATYGLGVPLIAMRRGEQQGPLEDYYPPGLSFPVTAFLRVDPGEGRIDEDGGQVHRCQLEIYDPMITTEIAVRNQRAPLQTDLSTPLAHFLNDPEMRNEQVKLLGLLAPGATEQMQGIYLMEPYDPQKIPVVMVHGLWSSPITWMEMFNDLRGSPEIRDRYQFWFYLYPTGQPFWVSATQLRDDLANIEHDLDPEGQSEALRQMVLIGHSMGGLVSKMQVVESGDDFWRLASDRPLRELELNDEEEARIAGLVHFEPSRSVRRIITLGTPHRGSEFANEITRWLASKVIALPHQMVSLNQRLLAQHPEALANGELLAVRTSIDSLSPDSPVIPVLLQADRAAWVQHHNIVGVIEDDTFLSTFSARGDGVVGFASAHLEEVESEIIVPADHTTVHRHPLAVLEVRRILRDHVRQYDAERTAGMRRNDVLPATYVPQMEEPSVPLTREARLTDLFDYDTPWTDGIPLSDVPLPSPPGTPFTQDAAPDIVLPFGAPAAN